MTTWPYHLNHASEYIGWLHSQPNCQAMHNEMTILRIVVDALKRCEDAFVLEMIFRAKTMDESGIPGAITILERALAGDRVSLELIRYLGG